MFFLGLVGYYGVGGVIGIFVYCFKILKMSVKGFKRWGWGYGGYGGYGFGYGYGGWGYVVFYGYFIIYLGFISIGFFGYVLVIFDVKNSIV